jgi:outer membrane protein TolC
MLRNVLALISIFFCALPTSQAASAASRPAGTPNPTVLGQTSPEKDLLSNEPNRSGDVGAELLTLTKAIIRALANNLDLQGQQLGLRSSEIYYQDAWDRMYLPQVSLNVNSNAAKTLANIPGQPQTPENHGYPSTSLGLNLGEYTLFNFGRDKLVFDQAKLDWDRSKEMLEESKRSVKFQVINAFWTLKSRLDKLDAYERSVDIAQAIVSLQESRIGVNRATWTDVSSSTVDLLTVKNLRDQSQTDARVALYNLNILLGDPAGTKYRIDEEIAFLPIKVTEEVLYETYLRESPNMKGARKDLLKSQLALELSEKQLMPLPTVKFSGITVGYGNNYYGGKSGAYTQYPGANNFDISAGINLTVPLTGPGGLFGSRTTELSQILVDQSELRLRDSGNKDRQIILQYVLNIRQFEALVLNNRQSYKSSMVVLQSVFDSFMTTKTVSRLDIRDAINQARDSEIFLADSILSHLSFKTQLAAFIGVDYLPRME